MRRVTNLSGLRFFTLWFCGVVIVYSALPDSIERVLAYGVCRVVPTKQELNSTGDVVRAVLTRGEMFANKSPSEAVDDSAAFARPAGAAEPAQSFEGTVTLNDVASSGNFDELVDIFRLIPSVDSPWKHLAPFHFQFVQSGSYLIPAQQGLAFVPSSRTWNYIIGPGRVWDEKKDEGYTRAAFPFALVQRNQNCVHNGEMTFLFSNASSPHISNVYYQITQETCYPMKFNLWGMASATYTSERVADDTSIIANYKAEMERRLPTKPFSDLARDFPAAGIDLAAFTAGYKEPENVTTYGLIINGTNYVAGCPTRSGQYAFCSDMRAPSYSIAKSAFAGVALMRLGQLYGPEVYDLKIKDFLPHSMIRGKWDATTFGNTSDMATGNFNLGGYEADENSRVNDKFLVDEAYAAKLSDSFNFKHHSVTPGTKWVYQSPATYILTQAMNAYFQRHGGRGDIFSMVRDDIYKPLYVNEGGLTTIRTDDSPAGAPAGYYGLFFNHDDIAKIGNFLNTSGGKIDGEQVLEPTRLTEALFQGPNVATAGVPIEGESASSLLGASTDSHGKAAQNIRRYSHGFWGRKITRSEIPGNSCEPWASFMAGYGGDIVMLLPNGVSFYIFSDGMEFPWESAVRESSKLAPMCKLGQ